MSVSWTVAPIIPDIWDWLRETGFELPEGEGRYPTLDETLAVLNSFDGLPVTERSHSLSSKIEAVLNRFKDQSVTHKRHSSDLWTLTIGTLHTDQYACLLGDIDPDGTYHFHFYGSGCQNETMVEILKRLSTACGPLVILESIAATPLVVTRDIDVQTAIADWEQRIRQHYDEIDQRQKPGVS